MPSRVPSARELEVLRYLAAGMRIAPRLFGHQAHPVVAKGVEVIRIKSQTVRGLFDAGWIAAADAGYLITRAGRDVAEAKAFVRAFAESLAP